MKRSSVSPILGMLVLAVLAGPGLAGCGHGGSRSGSPGTSAGTSASGVASGGGTAGGSAAAGTAGGGTGGTGTGSGGGTGGGDQGCSGGLKGTEPGVLSVNCGGTATIQVQAGGTGKVFHGGTCKSTGDYWSAAAGVVIDATGTHGQYTGPPVDSVALNNTDQPGKGTIQLSLGGKNLYDLGGASLSLSADKKTAHLAGTSGQLSDAPGTKLVIDVTC